MQEEQISLGISEDRPFSAPTLGENRPPYEPTPNDPPWNLPVALATFFLSLFFLVAFGSIPVVIMALVREVPKEDFGAFVKEPMTILLGLLGTIPAHLATLAFCWFVVTRKGKYSLNKTLGLRWGGFHIGYCLLTVIAFYIIFGTLISYFGPMDTDLDRMLRSSRAATLVTAALAVFTAPIVEELVFRGVLYSALQRSVGVPFAISITTLLFAGIHFPQYNESPVALIVICILSLGLTLIRWKSGNLLPCIVTHLIFNGVQSVLLVAEPYLPKEDGGEAVTGLITAIAHFIR
jgi:uncharacterized protein